MVTEQEQIIIVFNNLLRKLPNYSLIITDGSPSIRENDEGNPAYLAWNKDTFIYTAYNKKEPARTFSGFEHAFGFFAGKDYWEFFN